jgi:hypothetical protein
MFSAAYNPQSKLSSLAATADACCDAEFIDMTKCSGASECACRRSGKPHEILVRVQIGSCAAASPNRFGI